MSVSVSPSNGVCPVSISIQHAAERPDIGPLVHGLCRAPAPGDMYAAVPRITPASVWRESAPSATARSGDPVPARITALARPKSKTFTVPSGRSLIFAGLRSRWMMPCSCAASSASAICRRSATPHRAESGPARCDRPASALRPARARAPWSRPALEAVDGCDVGVIQRGEDFGFALEAR